jgi:hypothetical protein
MNAKTQGGLLGVFIATGIQLIARLHLSAWGIFLASAIFGVAVPLVSHGLEKLGKSRSGDS